MSAWAKQAHRDRTAPSPGTRLRAAEAPVEEPKTPKPPKAPAAPMTPEGNLDEKKILAALAKTRSSGTLNAQDNAEIAKLVGKFGDADRFDRPKIIERLRERSEEHTSELQSPYVSSY